MRIFWLALPKRFFLTINSQIHGLRCCFLYCKFSPILTPWARIAKNVKKPQGMLSILNFLVLMYPYGSVGVLLVPKSHNTFVELFRFTRYVERNKVHFAQFLRFHWNHYIVFPDFSDVWPFRGLTAKKGGKCSKHKI